jgi:hypothetical protein
MEEGKKENTKIKQMGQVRDEKQATGAGMR